MIIIQFLIVLVILAIVVYSYFNNTYKYWKKRNVVSPKPIFFFGNTKASALRQKHIAVHYKEFYNDFPNDKVVGIYRMTSPALLIRDLDIVKHILLKDFESFPVRGVEFSKEGLGDNLFHCDVTTWKALKSHMTPMFSAGKLKNIVGLLKYCSDNLVNHIENICFEEPEQEVTSLLQKYTMASIMACSFGINVDTIQNSKIFEQIGKSFLAVNYATELDMLFPGILKKTNMSLFSEIVNRFCYEVVEAVKLKRNGNPTVLNNIIDTLLFLQKQGEVKSLKREEKEQEVSIKLTDHVIAGQVFVYFAAGYGNNANVLSYALYHLAKNTEIQDKLIAEIDDILDRFAGDNTGATYDSLREMTYLNQFFYETMRMHPTTNAIQRYAVRDSFVPGTGLKIEKGTSIVISPLAIHHDEEFYPNPEQFDPDRFAPDVIKQRHTCAYLPFGAGPRSCLGSRFATLQFKMFVVTLLSKFRVEPSRRTKDAYSIDPRRSLLSPEGGIYLNIVPRSS